MPHLDRHPSRQPSEPGGGAEPLLTIGRFAARSGLSLKALRLYDELGLLRPHRVDGSSGYRYYSADQVDQARLIGLLRQVDMPLAEIGGLLENPDVERLRRWWARVDHDHAERAGVVGYLETVLGGGSGPAFEVGTRWVAAEKVATVSRRVLQPDLPGFIPEALGTLREHLGRSGARARDIDWTVYHGTITTDSAGLVEVCVPFEGTVEPTPEVAVRVEPAHHEAWTRLTKGQVRPPDVMYAFDAVIRWVREAGHAPALDPREIYVADWVAVDDDTPAVDVAQPYQPRSAG